jgi:hypothetical protein
MKLGHYSIVLGHLWLPLYDIIIKFQSRRKEFKSSYGQQYCQNHSSIWVWGNHLEYSKDSKKPKLDICAIAAGWFMQRNEKRKV